ncbi:hypothetical protein ACFVW8_38325 [Streptomyces sp. NPDC058221]|uniref:hypothetical protein n=1 Tax=Streptomyces sp. NPDC058221 TaxID=3346388 RepID=UPI0036E270BE
MHAEWTKLRTLASPLWLLLGTVVVTVGLSAVAASVFTCTDRSCGDDPTEVSLVGVDLGRAPVAILAVPVISNEYGTGMIRTTLTAVPLRTTVFAAKCAVVGGVVPVGGSVAVLGALLAGRMVMAAPVAGRCRCPKGRRCARSSDRSSI